MILSEMLVLYLTHFSLQTTKVLANVIKYNKDITVTDLDLSANREVEVEGIVALLDSLQYNQVLQALELEHSLSCCRTANLNQNN